VASLWSPVDKSLDLGELARLERLCLNMDPAEQIACGISRASMSRRWEWSLGLGEWTTRVKRPTLVLLGLSDARRVGNCGAGLGSRYINN
jgi:hypothetical protein